MLKVAFNASALLWPLTGVGQYAFHLAQGLQKQQALELDFFYANRFSREIAHTPSAAAGKLRVWVRKWVPNAYAIRMALEQRHFDKGARRGSFDLYHEPNYLALRFDGPTVITVHDLSWLSYPQTHPPERVRAMNRLFEPGLRGAARVITDSLFVKSEIVRVFGIDASLIDAIALGADPRFAPMGPDRTRGVLEQHGLLHGEYFLGVGTLEPRKNVQGTIDAHAALPPAVRARHPLVLAGMRGWRTSSLERRLEPLVRSGQVRVLGYLERDDLAAVTAGALAAVYPSLYEGFGLPPLEAMACGVPAITSNASSLPEVVGDGGIMVDPLDIQALATAMESIALEPQLRATLSQKASGRALRFSWDRCAAETAAVYRLAARPPPHMPLDTPAPFGGR